MNQSELELKLAEGSEILRDSILNDGMSIDEERPKSGRVLLRCSKQNKKLNASIALDTLGWRISIVSNNGIVENSTLKVNNCTIDGLKKLIERTGMKICKHPKRQVSDDPLPKILESRVRESRRAYETDPKKMGVRDVLRKVRNG